jgi:16S rRNA (cytosine967-C5)-methyltransferase
LYYLVPVSRFHSYLHSAKQILQLYNGEEPFASFLKKYFAANKKYGSKDRKQVSHLCYCFFRSATRPTESRIEEAPPDLGDKILAGLFLCSSEPHAILEALKPEWNEKVNSRIKEKYSIVNQQSSIGNIFPWKEELSPGIDHEIFCESFFIQPDLFLRLRPGKEKTVIRKLERAGIKFEIISETCLSLPNASKIDEIIEIDKEALIQDYSSQRTGEFIKSAIVKHNAKPSVWDCCAASGGKSIMACDINPDLELTVTDIRESILANLKTRFLKAGITGFKSFVTDLTQASVNIQKSLFDIILCDVPCSGSGTWSRTPEQRYYFDENKIREYVILQKKIVSRVIPYLKPGGSLIYMTCSVFKKENEEIVEFIKQKFNLGLDKMELLKGYDQKGDTMFAAVFNS